MLTGVLSLLSAQDDGVAPEEGERLHRGGVDGGDRVVIGSGLVDD